MGNAGYLLAAFLYVNSVPACGGWVVSLMPNSAGVAPGAAAGPPPSAQVPLLPWVSTKFFDFSLPRDNLAPRACSGLFAVLFLFITCDFLFRGREFARAGKTPEATETQEQEPDPESAPTSSCTTSGSAGFHLLLAMAALDIALSYALSLSGVRSPFLLAWPYCGRILAIPLIVTALGLASSAPLAQVLPAISLSVAAWVKLGLAAASLANPMLRFGLLCGGTFSGAVALHVLDSAITTTELGKRHLRPIMDLATFCAVGYLLVWVVTEGTLMPTLPTVAVVLNGCIDLLCIAGCGHLLLKKSRWPLLRHTHQRAA